MKLQKILGIAVVMGCMSCHEIIESVNDTFHGTRKENDKRNDSDDASVTTRQNTTTITVSSSSSSSSSSLPPNESKGFFSKASRLTAAENALRRLPAFAGRDIYLYEAIHFYDDGRINMKVQNPDNPAYVDAYSFDKGSWQEPQPVQLSVHDEIASRLVKLDDLHFSSVETVYRNYRMKADSIPGAAPLSHVYAILRKNTYTWYPQSISGSRERYFISFTKEGEVQDFYRQ